MMEAPLPPDEKRRLEALRRTGLLDARDDPAFNDFARIAAHVCGTSTAMISLIDADRQIFKGKIGTTDEVTPRGHAFCAHAILERAVMEVPDAQKDRRFHDNPLVTGPPRIRFYAGAPLVMPEGQALGTVCATDVEPHTLTDAQREAMEALARQVVNYIVLRMREQMLDRSTLELQRTQRERHTASRAVQSLLNLQRAIFEGASYAIIACSPDGAILSFNKAASRMLGYDASEVIGQQTQLHFHLPAEIEARARQLSEELGERVEPGLEALRARARRGLPDEREWTFVRKDGSKFPVLLAMTALRDQQGMLTGFVGLAQDITERKQVETLKNEFVSIVSHELRTPLTSIRGALGLLEGGVLGALPDQAREMIAIARQNSDRLIRLINEILDLDKIEAGKMELKLERVEVAELAQQALAGMRGFASSSSIELKSKIGEGLTVHADRDRLVQVLTNLLSNAIKFSPASGVVELRAEVLGASVRFAVQDSGPGIPEHNRQLLFRKFQQLDSTDARRKGGTGLGLAITRAIVEQHRGRIWVESEAGKGATFLFELPRLAAAPTPFAGLQAMISWRKVLLVEDDPDLAGILARTLAGEGLSPVLAPSLAAARASLLEGRPDAVLLDLELPDGDGLELLEELRRDARTAEVPVLVISARARSDRKQLAEPVVVDWLHKPFEQDALKAALRRALKDSRGKVLLVAPDSPARAELVEALSAAGLQMELAQTAREAVPLLVALTPDLVLYEPQPGDDEILSDLLQKQQLVGRPTPLLLYADAGRAPEERRRLAASLAALLPRGEATQESFVRAVREMVERFAPRRPQ